MKSYCHCRQLQALFFFPFILQTVAQSLNYSKQTPLTASGSRQHTDTQVVAAVSPVHGTSQFPSVFNRTISAICEAGSRQPGGARCAVHTQGVGTEPLSSSSLQKRGCRRQAAADLPWPMLSFTASLDSIGGDLTYGSAKTTLEAPEKLIIESWNH